MNRQAWSVYMITAAMFPLTFIGSAVAFSVVACFIALDRGQFTPEAAQAILQEELGKGAPMLALSVGVNALVFTLVPLFVARRHATREVARQRLALDPQAGSLPRSGVWDALWATLALLGLTTALDALVGLSGLENYGRLAEMRDTFGALPPLQRLPLAFVVAVGAGIPEELFFRGYVLRRLVSIHGRATALLISALLFGLFHLDPLHAPLAAAMGLLLGWIVLATGSIYPAIIAHIVNNAAAAMTATLEIPEAASLAMLAGGIVVATLAVVAIRRRHGGVERPIVW